MKLLYGSVCMLILFGLMACSPPGTSAVSTPSVAVSSAITQTMAPTMPALSSSMLSGRIVYAHEGDIYVMNADGSNPTRLTTHPDMDFDPVWSPDGAQIAFRSHRDGNEEVYLMNADGSNQHNLTNARGGDYSPAWSPDGRWIAFMSDRGGNPNIWIIQPDGSALQQVTDLRGISEYPTWSPDSQRIAFHCTHGRILPSGTGDFEICVVNVDGTGMTQLTDAPGESKLPAWSPDGEKIAFQSERDGWPTLPDYVPPGYDAEDFGDDEIYWMNVDGTDQQNLTQHPEEGDSFPAWSADGYLIFSRYDCLTVMNPQDLSIIQISKDECLGIDGGFFADWYQPQK